MAKATKHEIRPTPPPYTVTLELSQGEAEVLKFLVGRLVNWDGAGGESAEAIWTALDFADVEAAKFIYDDGPIVLK